MGHMKSDFLYFHLNYFYMAPEVKTIQYLQVILKKGKSPKVMMGCGMAVQWLALKPATKFCVETLTQPGHFSVWSLHVLHILMYVSSVYSGFLLQSKDVRLRLIGDSS